MNFWCKESDITANSVEKESKEEVSVDSVEELNLYGIVILLRLLLLLLFGTIAGLISTVPAFCSWFSSSTVTSIRFPTFRRFLNIDFVIELVSRGTGKEYFVPELEKSVCGSPFSCHITDFIEILLFLWLGDNLA